MKLLIFTLFTAITAFDKTIVDLAIDYFKLRNVKFVCMVTCHDDFRSLEFSKSATNKSIAVSLVNLDNLTDYDAARRCMYQKLQFVGVFLDADCKGSEQILYLASRDMMLDNNHKWLIAKDLSDHNCTETVIDCDNITVLDVIETLNVSIDADIVMVTQENSSYLLHDIYNFGKIQGGKLKMDEIGTWDSYFDLKTNLNEYKYYRRWNFGNWTMRMILVVSPMPENFDMSLLSGLKSIPGVATITHISGAVLNVIAEIHNFRYQHTITDRWIGLYDTKSKRVVSNSLYFREQDVTPVIRYSINIIDKLDIMALPTASIETRYYYRIPTTGPGKFENQFLRPLSSCTWLSVIAVSVLCGILLLASARYERHPSSLQYAVFSVVASICQQFFQDSDENGIQRTSLARKITILVTGLSCVLIYNYYTSSVVSWLLIGPPPSINSLRELLESPLDLIYEDIGYTRSWLQTPTYYYNKRNAKIEDELRQKKVFNKKKDAPLLEPLVEGIKMVQKGGYAYHTEVNNANNLISKTFSQRELCELGSLQSMERTNLYPCAQKNSPYKEFLTWSLLRLKERGIISCIQSRMASKEVKCEGSSPRPLALGGAAPAFILLAGGFMLATGIMFIERWVYKYNNAGKSILSRINKI